jgi:hypothetical protein
MNSPRNSAEQFQKLAEQGLDNWLTIATGDLENSAQKRVKAEIESHYADAVADHILCGELEPVARSKAFIELGDPTAAKKKFKRLYLTQNEAKYLVWTEKTAARPLFSMGIAWLDYGAVITVVLLFILMNCRIVGSFNFALIPGALIFEYFTARIIPRYAFLHLRPSLLRQTIAFTSSTSDIFSPTLLTAFFISPPWLMLGIFLGMNAVSSILIRGSFQTWLKLRRLCPPSETRSRA